MDAYLQQDVAGQLARVEETLGVSQQKQEEFRTQLGVCGVSVPCMCVFKYSACKRCSTIAACHCNSA